MNFGEAIEYCKQGAKIRNENWNGKGMYVYYTPGRYIFLEDWTGEVTEQERQKGAVRVLGHFDMINAQGERVIGWLASQMDMLSDAWEIVPDEPKDIEGIKRLFDEMEQ